MQAIFRQGICSRHHIRILHNLPVHCMQRSAASVCISACCNSVFVLASAFFLNSGDLFQVGDNDISINSDSLE